MHSLRFQFHVQFMFLALCIENNTKHPRYVVQLHSHMTRDQIAKTVANKITRHRASTSMYSLIFCVRFLMPERHQWKPAVQTAAVMLRTPSVDGQSPASQPRPLRIYGTQFWECPRHTPVSGQQRVQNPPASRLHYVVISRDGHTLVTRVRVLLP